MSRRRIQRDPYELAVQLESASVSAAAEPNWPGSAPSPATLSALAASLKANRTKLVVAESTVKGLRLQLETDSQEGQRLMRLVDHVTSALYGETGGEKNVFGLRPIDKVRNSPPEPKEATKLRLVDGPEPASVTLRWKSELRSRYLVEAWDGVPESEGAKVIEARSETMAHSTFLRLPVGAKVYVRVKVIAGKRSGPWSEPLSRFVN